MKKYLAELFGTFLLSLVVVLSVAGVSYKETTVLAGFTLVLLVYMIGPISGSHVNPAVSFGLWMVGKMKKDEMLHYIGAQFVGALIALGVSWTLIDNLSQKLASIQILVGNYPKVGIGEALGALVFGFGILSVVSGKTKAYASGVVIGGSLFLGLTIARPFSAAILNPAVAVSLGAVDSMYMFAPLIGIVLGMKLFLYISSRR